MINKKRYLTNYFWLYAILLSIPAGISLLVPGYYGASDDLHAAWLFELDRTLKMGQIPPRFVPDLSFGFGYPLFSFVYPLPFYIAELFHLIGFSLVDSVKILFFLTIPTSAWLMYILLRKFVSKWLALAGSVIYIYTPYRAVDIYIRGAIGEILSFVFLPLIALSLVKIVETKQWDFRWIGLGSIGMGGLILTHNITAYMVIPLFGLLFLLLLVKTQTKWLFIMQTLISALGGLLVSCFFWVPAIFESNLMKYDTVFNYYDHFPTLRQLVTPYWGYGASVPGPYDGIPFFIGFPALLLLLAVFGIVVKEAIVAKKVSFSLVSWWALFTIGVSIIMMNYRSDYLWKNLPLLPYFQFPWRFLIVMTFSVPLLVVFFKDIKHQKALAIGLMAIAISTMISNFRPQDFLGRTDQYYLNRYIPFPTASSDYYQTQEEYLRLPQDTEKRPDKLYPRIIAQDKTATIIVQELNALDTVMQINATQSSLLDYNKYNYPGWQIREDGKEISFMTGKPFGHILIPISPGLHRYEILFRETKFRIVMNIVSFISLIMIIGMLFWQKEKNND